VTAPAGAAARPRLLLLLSNIGLGGAQRQALMLLDRVRGDYDVSVAYLQETVEPLDVRPRLAALGIAPVRLGGPLPLQFLRLVRFIRRGRFDVVQTLLYRANVLGVVAARLAGVRRVVASVRGTASWNPSSRTRFHARLERIALRRADAVVCNSAAVADYVRGRGTDPAKLRVIMNGVEPAAVSAADVAAIRSRWAAGDAVLVGLVARLDPQKDVAGFLRAAAVVARERPETRFLVVGGGALGTELKAAAGTLGIADRVGWAGAVPDARAYTAALDVAVLPSREGEGLSNFVLEAMAAGKPVVATDVGGSAELVAGGQTGFVVPPGEPGALAAAIGRLAADAGLRRRMGEAGAARVRSLCDPDAMAGAFRALWVGTGDPNLAVYGSYYDKPRWWWALRYDNQIKRRTVLHLLGRAGKPRNGVSVLDIGFGSATILFSFARDCELTGVEVSPSALARARAEAARRGFARASFHAAGPRLPCPDAGQDVVIASHVLEHVDDDAALLREIRRVLKPDGAALVMVPVNERYADPKHARSYTQESLGEAARAAGLAVVGGLVNERLYHLVEWFYARGWNRLPVAGPAVAAAFNVPAAHLPWAGHRAADALLGALGLPPRQLGVVMRRAGGA